MNILNLTSKPKHNPITKPKAKKRSISKIKKQSDTKKRISKITQHIKEGRAITIADSRKMNDATSNEYENAVNNVSLCFFFDHTAHRRYFIPNYFAEIDENTDFQKMADDIFLGYCNNEQFKHQHYNEPDITPEVLFDHFFDEIFEKHFKPDDKYNYLMLHLLIHLKNVYNNNDNRIQEFYYDFHFFVGVLFHWFELRNEVSYIDGFVDNEGANLLALCEEITHRYILEDVDI